MKNVVIILICAVVMESCFSIKAKRIQKNGIYEVNCFEKSLVDLSKEFNERIANDQSIEKEGKMSIYQVIDVKISKNEIIEILWYEQGQFKPLSRRDLYVITFINFLTNQKLGDLKGITESKNFTVRIELMIDSCGFIFMSGEYLRDKDYQIDLNLCPFDPKIWLNFIDTEQK